ncbi:MAG: adenylate/guanylate cyclase domain-containing protein [Anaerolineales bacterium]
MNHKVLLVQTDQLSIKVLREYFLRHGDRVWLTEFPEKALKILENERPDLAFIDLHLPETPWMNLLDRLHRDHPQTHVIITNKQPDVRRELLAKELGFLVFLRYPFTPQWIEKALRKVKRSTGTDRGETGELHRFPKVRVPMRIKITAPYVFLALAFVLASLYLGGRYLIDSFQERFTNQLIDAGKLASDWMVSEENNLLATERLVANTQGVAEYLSAGDSNALRRLLLPVALNYSTDAMEILDIQGKSVLSLRHAPDAPAEDIQATQGDPLFTSAVFVQKVIHHQTDNFGDKYAGLWSTPLGPTFYVAGPIIDDSGRVVGAVLIGCTLDHLVRLMRQETLAHLTIYSFDGTPLASTLFRPGETFPITAMQAFNVLQNQDQESALRDLQVASVSYTEVLGPWEARWGNDLGVMGVALAQSFIVRPSQFTRVQAVLFVALAFIGIILLGLFLARRITNPLREVVNASTQVAEGNFKVKVPVSGNDEVMVLAHAFNYMVTGLQEGSIYRDLLGRTVSPQVREALRKSFASGELKLEGQNTTATVLMSDIRNFTSMAEKEEPTTILHWLNEYFRELVPIITKYGGVVDKFEGDAILAFFGILPTPLQSKDSAYNACLASMEMLEVVERINQGRIQRNEPPFRTGIGINTGNLIAGGLGTADRLNYTIIGDTVNTTQRIQDLTRQFGESGVAVSESTVASLHEKRGDFKLEPLGEHALKGKSELIWVYRLKPGLLKERKKDPEATPPIHQHSSIDEDKATHSAQETDAKVDPIENKGNPE